MFCVSPYVPGAYALAYVHRVVVCSTHTHARSVCAPREVRRRLTRRARARANDRSRPQPPVSCCFYFHAIGRQTDSYARALSLLAAGSLWCNCNTRFFNALLFLANTRVQCASRGLRTRTDGRIGVTPTILWLVCAKGVTKLSVGGVRVCVCVCFAPRVWD